MGNWPDCVVFSVPQASIARPEGTKALEEKDQEPKINQGCMKIEQTDL